MTVTRAMEQQSKPLTLVQFVQQMRPELERALPKHLNGDRVARLALTVIRQTPALAKCDQAAFAGALLTAAALGLEPGVDGEAYLVPYGRECQFIAGYKGIAKLFWQHPLAKFLDAQAVYERDQFDYGLGLDPYLTHKPAFGDRGQIIAFYAVATLTTGAAKFEVMSPDEIAAVRKGARKPSVADPQHWMERKTVLKQLLKIMPKSTQLANALAVDERTGTDLAAHKVPESINADDAVAIEPPQEPESSVDQATGEVIDAEVVDPRDDPNFDPWAAQDGAKA